MNNVITITPINEDLNVKKYKIINNKKKLFNSNIGKFYFFQSKQINVTLKKISNIENKLIEYEKIINKLIEKFPQNKENKFEQKIFYKGQTWDSYELIIDIIKTAQHKIVIIDNFIDYTILKMLKNKNSNVEVKIITSSNCKLSKLDIYKFNTQYPSIELIKTNKFHDRFIIIDEKELYHCGASIKDLGTKCFVISKIEEENFINKIEELCNMQIL